MQWGWLGRPTYGHAGRIIRLKVAKVPYFTSLPVGCPNPGPSDLWQQNGDAHHHAEEKRDLIEHLLTHVGDIWLADTWHKRVYVNNPRSVLEG
jgi:hypothetical protein